MGRYVQKPYGSIQLEDREDDTVVIILEYQTKDMIKKIELKLRDLADVLTPERDVLAEDLHEPWFSQRKENSWTVYRQGEAKALCFISKSPIERKDLFLIMEERSYFSMRFGIENNLAYAYFSALALAWHIKNSFGLSMSELLSLEDMEKKRLALLAEHSEMLPLFKEHGIDIKQLTLVDFAKLKNCFEHRWELPKALSLISLPQILGLGRHPFPSKSLEEKLDPQETSVGYSSGSFSTSEGKFSHERGEQSLKLTYKRTKTPQEWNFNFKFGTINEEYSATIGKEMKNQGSLESLIHDWYCVVSFQHSSRTYYSPAINFIIIEKLDPDYATGYTELMLDPLAFSLFNILLSSLPYYEERQLIEELNAQSLSLEEFKNISGFSKDTLLLLSKNKDWRKLLASKEISFQQLARINEMRLVSLLQNQKEVQSALNFIDMFELLGIENEVNPSQKARQEIQPALKSFRSFSCLKHGRNRASKHGVPLLVS